MAYYFICFYRNYESSSDLRKDKKNAEPFYFNERDAEQENVLVNRMKDIKNRIELRRMLSEYESGHLKPPIYYKNDIIDPEDLYVDETDEEFTPYPLKNRKRLFTQAEDIEDKYPARFSDLASNYNSGDDDYATDGKNKQYFDAPNYNSNELQEPGVYTEGGLIYENATPQQQKACKYGIKFSKNKL